MRARIVGYYLGEINEEGKIEIQAELQRKDAELKEIISKLGISQAKKRDLEAKLEAFSESKNQLADKISLNLLGAHPINEFSANLYDSNVE